PEVWRRALDLVPAVRAALPPVGATALFIGCGTSAFVARAAAWLREAAGAGPSDWAYASELPPGRAYDHVVGITRPGTTTEVLAALDGPLSRARRLVITGAPGTAAEVSADAAIGIPFADEQSVVQTRFPTTVLLLLRAALGEDPQPILDDGARAQAM